MQQTPWLQRWEGNTFRANELLKGVSRTAVPTAAALSGVLPTLERAGVIERVPSPGERGRGRPPGAEYVIHRSVLAKYA